MKRHIRSVTLAFTLMLIGCATQPMDVHSTSTAQLMERRAEIDRKLREDDFGVYIGVTRWISHASEKKSVLKEREAIDAELARRHVKLRTSASSPADTSPRE